MATHKQISPVMENVREIIEERGLLQKKVAKDAGYTVQMFSAMMNGRKQVTDSDISRLTFALNVDANRLFKTHAQ